MGCRVCNVISMLFCGPLAECHNAPRRKLWQGKGKPAPGAVGLEGTPFTGLFL